MKKIGVIFFTFIFVVSCGGGGGGGGGSTPPPNPAPSVNLSASASEQLVNSNVTLTWSSSNATSCSASGDWSGTKSTSGSEDVTISKAGSNTYSLACSGAGGNRSDAVIVVGYRNTDGIVVDGYISGADVFIDENDNFVNDGSEYSTTSDNEGKFTIRYANGNLVSIGGTDLDSQTLLDNLLITHKLTGHSEFKAVTPVTSIEAFMEVGANINNALGIDSAIDISVTDPVANKGDGGIYDFLYEKGNQLTVLAYALQNITNDLNTTSETTEDYFKAIAEEIENEFNETSVKVDIETETFVNKAFENVIAVKSVTIDETAKANTVKALSGVLPIVEVKASDDLTTSVIRFAVSTLQEDIKAIANGSATAETVTSYTSDVLAYIAEDQNIDADKITPDISAITDSAITSEDTAIEINVLLNDSYLTSAPVIVSAGNGSNGTTSVANNIITYDPDTDYNGTDTFSYTITQGDKTSSTDVTVTIEAANDAPSIDIASIILVEENQTVVTTVAVSDVDEDELTLTLSGTDADSFNLSDENDLSFKEAPDYETKDSYSITLTLTDDTETVTKNVTVSITNVNDVAPEFTSDAIFSVVENQTFIGTVTAIDAEGDDVSFTVSGSELAITSAGVLTFVSAPDYEFKSIYTAVVTASDGTNSTTQDITINILDVSETPPVFGSTVYTVDERQLEIGMIDVNDADGDDLILSISGGDANYFVLNSAFRTIQFKDIPIYSEKNTYKTNIFANDGMFTSSQELIVNLREISQLNTDHPQAIVGTDGNDTIQGNDRQYDILIGGKGDDTLIGGINKSGGYFIDIYQFGEDSGNDIIEGFFIQKVFEDNDGVNITYGEVDGRPRNDFIEIVQNVNGTNINSAQDIFNNSSNNSDGDAVLNLGQGNTITIKGISLEQLKPDHINIIPTYLGLVQGEGFPEDIDNTLSALKSNTRIEGSNDPFDKSDDGQDFIVSGDYDDVLIGGTNGTGPWILDLYEFKSGSGNDLILGYFDMDFDREDSNIYYDNPQGSGARSDKIILPKNINNSSINSFSDILEQSSNNEDGWARINLGSGNSIIVHGVPFNKLKADSFIFTYSESYNKILGEENANKNNIIEGTPGNDWIQGSPHFLDKSGDGVNYFFPNEGDDILVSDSIRIYDYVGSDPKDTYFTNNYFINSTGKKTIVGFSARSSEYFNPNTKHMLDRIFFEKRSTNYLSDLSISIDEDGFINLLPDDDITVKLHSITEGFVDTANIILHDPFENYIYGSRDDDILTGTSGNDYIDGWGEYNSGGGSPCFGIESGDDILEGKEGNDVLVGGVSTHFCGGYNRDIFRFAENSGQDVIVDFTSNFERPGYVDNFKYLDALEIEENINGLSFRTAKSIIDISSDNKDGFAEINLGSGNTITLHDKSLSTISPMHFRIIPKIDKYIFGTEGDDLLEGSNLNEYIRGSTDSLGRFSDGYDILDGGSGDDVLEGGSFEYTLGGYITDIYKFDSDYGYNRIFGFSAKDLHERYTGSVRYTSYEAGIRSDKIEIPNDIVSSASELINNSVNNDDGWAQLTFSGTDIVLHMVPKEDLKPDYFYILPRTTNTIIGTDECKCIDYVSGVDTLIGTDANDKIMGSPNPFERFHDGGDFIEGGKGDDVLIGGPAAGTTGGYHKDRYRFNEDFGNDYLISFFAEDLVDSTIGYSNPDGDGAKQSDRLEINNIFAETATEIISNAENNPDGWARIILGNNSIVLFGVPKQDLKPDYFHIIPNIQNTIIGNDSNLYEDGDDTLNGTEDNDYILGGPDPFGLGHDGDDTLIGGAGDDVLIGGPNDGRGCWSTDTYIFEANSGNDLIIGFLFDGTGCIVSGGAEIFNDVIEIPYNVNGSGISSFDDVLASTTNNADGWAVIDLGDNNSITLHGVPKEKLLARNFNITGIPESNRPEIFDLSVTPNEINVSAQDQDVTLSIRITDESGIVSTGTPHVQLPAGSKYRGSWTLISGDNKDGVYESVITVPTTAAPGDYGVFSGFITDEWDNTSSFSISAGDEDGLTVTNSNTESNRPEIFDLSVTPNEINVSAQDQDVTLSIRITDESGIVSTGTPHVQLPAGSKYRGSWTLISGDNKDGVYESVITVPTTAAPGDYGVFSGFITDEWDNTSSFSISAGDEDGLTVTNSTSNENEPVFTSEPSFSADENQTAIGTVAATDADGDTLSYSISGSDIIIDSSSGVIAFASAPNYETKSTYTATVSASDGAYTTTQDITVNVTDVNDMPVATAASYYLNLLPQDQSGGNITLSATDEDGDTLTYSIVNDVSYGSTSISGATVTYLTSASTQSAQSESFTFKVNDGTVDSETATISIDLRTDPLYKYQWHLNNTGQTNFATNGGTAGQDLNLDSVIVDGITGDGVVVSVIDDGLEIAHEDLVDNVINGSWDFVNEDSDPTQASECTSDEIEAESCGGHGTSIAGIIGAKGWNNIGVRGIAPDVSLIGYNFLESGDGVDYLESLGTNPSGSVTADIYNMSFGAGYPDDDDGNQLANYDLPQFMSTIYEDAFINGVTNLRNGKGALYIWSAGNEYAEESVDGVCGTGQPLTCTEISLDNKSGIPYIIPVAALDADGIKTSYSTTGPAMWVSGFAGENGANQSVMNSQGYETVSGLYEPATMTVDRSSCQLGYVSNTTATTLYSNAFENPAGHSENPNCNYTSTFNGTSAAAPTVSGVIALMLEANPDLTWRDVKHILVTSSEKIDDSRSTSLGGITQYSWVENSAGHEHHNWYGFGKVNAAAAVAAAQDITPNNLGSFIDTGFIGYTVDASLPDNSSGTVSLDITKPSGSNGIVEFVRLSIDFEHSEAFSLGMRLQSPSGTVVNIMQPYTNINDPGGDYWIDIGVSAFYGETMEGTWTLEITDYSEGVTGTLNQWGIQVYGN